METCLRKLHFHTTLSVYVCVCVCVQIYLFIYLSVLASPLVVLMALVLLPQLHLSPSGPRLGSPDPNFSAMKFLPTNHTFPALCANTGLQGGKPLHRTLVALGRKIMLWFSSLRRNLTAHSTTVSNLNKTKCFKKSHCSRF